LEAPLPLLRAGLGGLLRLIVAWFHSEPPFGWSAGQGRGHPPARRPTAGGCQADEAPAWRRNLPVAAPEEDVAAIGRECQAPHPCTGDRQVPRWPCAPKREKLLCWPCYGHFFQRR